MSCIDRIQKFSGMWYYRGEQTKAFTIVGQACVCKSFGEDEEGEAALMIVYEGKENCYPDIITREQFRTAPVHPQYLFEGDLVYEEYCGKVLGIFRVSLHESEDYVRLVRMDPISGTVNAQTEPFTAHRRIRRDEEEVMVPSEHHQTGHSVFRYASPRKIEALFYEARRNNVRLLAHNISNLISEKCAYVTDEGQKTLIDLEADFNRIINRLNTLTDGQDK